jgi:hypothetical protein
MVINTDGSEIMSNASGLPYQAAIPPVGATCHGNLCGSVAAVRLVVPRPEISGQDADSPLAVWDVCELHWPSFRWACERSGHPVIDTTGDIRGLQDEFPRWNVWCSDAGRLYAACYVTGPEGPHGITVDAFLAGQLRAQMHTVDARELHHV